MSTSGLVPKELAAIMGVADTQVRFENTNSKPRNHRVYHPSALGGCLRLMQYQRFGEDPEIEGVELEEEEFESRVLRIFGNGHGVGDRWVEYFTRAGVLRGVWECENRFCKSFDSDGNFLGTDKLKEITDKVKEVSEETPDYLHNLPEEERRAEIKVRNSLFPRRYGYEDKLGSFKPEVCKCGCSDFKYHEVSVKDEELNIQGNVDLILDFSNFDVEKYSSETDGNKGLKLVKRTFDPRDLPTSPVVIDMKSINDRGFQKLKKEGPSLKYEVQVKVYCNILDVDHGYLIYENKNDQDTASFRIERSSEVDWPNIEKQIRTMNKMYKKRKLPPPRPLRQDSYDCKYCSYKERCHSSPIWVDPELNGKRINFYGKLL